VRSGSHLKLGKGQDDERGTGVDGVGLHEAATGEVSHSTQQMRRGSPPDVYATDKAEDRVVDGRKSRRRGWTTPGQSPHEGIFVHQAFFQP
jgi:hypothetical protein